ncbi:MAG: hypothetical protein H0T46_00690 [Deltaproteobacteria bacterium]|nr:hypothetical protein [Deltaproteobacteria bacterium]
MRAGLALIVLAFGCGSSKPQPTPPTPTDGSAAGSATTAPPTVAAIAPATPEQVCKRIIELKAQKCGMFANADFDEAGCMKELAAAADDPMLKIFTECVVQTSCEEVTNCIMAAAQAPQQQDLRACNDKSSMSPVGLPRAEWDKRNGAAATKFSQVKSSKEAPVEMCGINEENRWLESLSCDDGSKPVAQAEMVRAGNVGPGGRCGSIIDQYNVTCPGGKQYPIFIDAYVCPKP